MMKLSLAVFASLLLFFVVFPKHVVFAADSGTQSAVVSPTVVPDYSLPYPGLLPDNPLYFLKVLRDRLILFFISSPVKKSTFYLLQSDKRLEAGWYLLKDNEKNEPLVTTTISKSTNYLQQALDSAKEAQSSGENVDDLKSKLQSAAIKHTAVVSSMLHLPGATQRGDLVQEEKRLMNVQKAVEDFSQKQ